MSNSIHRTFVTLDDITGHSEPMNYVIYNPTKVKFDTGSKIFKKQMFECFGIDFPVHAIHELLTYDVNHLDQFIERCKEMIEYYKHS